MQTKNRRLEVHQAHASDWEAISQIRHTVFVEEQRVAPGEEYDVYEATARHYLATLDGKPIGTGRWRETHKGIKLERLATLKAARCCGAASRILQAMITDSEAHKKLRYMHAQMASKPFYQKRGFEARGATFMEAGIRHVEMILARDAQPSLV